MSVSGNPFLFVLECIDGYLCVCVQMCAENFRLNKRLIAAGLLVGPHSIEPLLNVLYNN